VAAAAEFVDGWFGDVPRVDVSAGFDRRLRNQLAALRADDHSRIGPKEPES
jgi:hypothetical protein